jgi:hypothetical protein
MNEVVRDKAQLALTQLAEVTDAKQILTEEFRRYEGGKSSKRLWAQAVRYRDGDINRLLSEWNAIKFKMKS